MERAFEDMSEEAYNGGARPPPEGFASWREYREAMGGREVTRDDLRRRSDPITWLRRWEERIRAARERRVERDARYRREGRCLCCGAKPRWIRRRPEWKGDYCSPACQGEHARETRLALAVENDSWRRLREAWARFRTGRLDEAREREAQERGTERMGVFEPDPMPLLALSAREAAAAGIAESERQLIVQRTSEERERDARRKAEERLLQHGTERRFTVLPRMSDARPTPAQAKAALDAARERQARNAQNR